MLHAYPDSFPTAAGVQLLTAFLRGQPVDVKEVAHAAWHGVGFGLSQWDTGPHFPMAAAAASMSNEEMAAKLEECCTMKAAADAKGFDWMSLLPIFLQILEKLLKK